MYRLCRTNKQTNNQTINQTNVRTSKQINKCANERCTDNDNDSLCRTEGLVTFGRKRGGDGGIGQGSVCTALEGDGGECWNEYVLERVCEHHGVGKKAFWVLLTMI